MQSSMLIDAHPAKNNMAGEQGVALGQKRGNRDEDLDSEFEFGSERKRSAWNSDPIASQKQSHLTHVPSHSAAIPSKQLVVSERDKEEWRARRYHYLAMDAYSRHKALVNQYLLSCGQGIEHFKRSTEGDRNDYSVLAEEHRFVWESNEKPDTWEKRLAKAYYDKLFKEYAIADLTRYKENMVAMRWRIEKELCDGKGQFSCGNKHCSRTEELTSWEVNFSYSEQGERKNALVKLRLCPKCSKKLNYHKKCKVWGDKKKKGLKRKEKKTSKKHRSKDKRNKDDRRSKKHHSSKVDVRDSTSSESSEGSDDGGEEGSGDAASGVGGAGESSSSEIWKKPAEAFLEKSKNEEFDDYFKDMLL